VAVGVAQLAAERVAGQRRVDRFDVDGREQTGAVMAAKRQKRVEKVGWYDGVHMPVTRLLREVESKVLRPALKKDEDGDWPVDVVIVDRTRYHRMHYRPVPYTHDRTAVGALAEVTMEDLEEAERVCEGNLARAVEEFGKIRRDIRERRAKEALVNATNAPRV
jgi:hypothetical protein